MSQPSEETPIVFEVAKDAMSATITIPEDIDRSLVTPEHLARLAMERNIAVDEPSLARLREIVASYLANPRDLTETFAHGTRPVHGENARIEWLPGFDPTEAPEEEAACERGPIDFYNAVSYIRVGEGEHLGTLIPPTDGVDGRTATGKVLAAKRGRGPNPALDDKTIEVDAEGRILSRLVGVLQVLRGTVRVANLLDIPEYVDFSTGNIDTKGSVVIGRGVRDRFTVIAAEDVTVEGLVEGATIQCGGNLTLKRGMASRENAVLDIGKNAEVGFLNNVRGIVRGTLAVHREMMNCELEVNRDILAERASIIGGRITVAGSVVVDTLGSPSETRTTLVVGIIPRLFADRERLANEIKQHDDLIARWTNEFDLITRGFRSPSDEQKAHLAKLSSRIEERTAVRSVCAEELGAIEGTVKEACRVDVSVKSTLHPQVALVIGGRTLVFYDPVVGPLNIHQRSNGRLVLQRGTGAPEDLMKYASSLRNAA